MAAAQSAEPSVAPGSLQHSPLYSEQLGIQLRKRTNHEYFKWFLASILFGGHISETIARRTYRTFQSYGVLTPRKIIACGWDFLVDPIMREGGYVRYDGRKSEQILRNCQTLLSEYRGRLINLHQWAAKHQYRLQQLNRLLVVEDGQKIILETEQLKIQHYTIH